VVALILTENAAAGFPLYWFRNNGSFSKIKILEMFYFFEKI
jgi:hypothetical protein